MQINITACTVPANRAGRADQAERAGRFASAWNARKPGPDSSGGVARRPGFPSCAARAHRSMVRLGQTRSFDVESVLTLSDAKARFSEIVEKAINGDEFIVTRMGRPVVRISRVATNAEPRKLGDLAGKIWMSEDFDDWPSNLQDALGMTDAP